MLFLQFSQIGMRLYDLQTLPVDSVKQLLPLFEQFFVAFDKLIEVTFERVEQLFRRVHELEAITYTKSENRFELYAFSLYSVFVGDEGTGIVLERGGECHIEHFEELIRHCHIPVNIEVSELTPFVRVLEVVVGTGSELMSSDEVKKAYLGG